MSVSRPRSEQDLSRFKKDLLDLIGGEFPADEEKRVYVEMLFNIALLKEEALDLAELRLLNTAFKELRYALKVFKSYRSVPKAAVFGSARIPRSNATFKMAKEFGRKLAQKGWMIITGGASGIMEAAMIGAGAKNSFGLNILLPFEQQANWVIRGNQKLIHFKYFFTRKLMFLKESEATVLFPGGFGTFDEGFESFTLVQTGKAKPRPIVVIDPPKSRFWRSALGFIKEDMGKGELISPEDLSLIRHFQDNDQAIEEMTRFYSNYESSRFFRDKYLIRLHNPLSNNELKKIEKNFKDILSAGGFELLPSAEEDDNKDPKLCRLVFSFDRSNYARLRQLIDYLNTL